MSANRWLARAEEIRRARTAPAPLETRPDEDEDIERAAIMAEGASVPFVPLAHVQESANSPKEHPPEGASTTSGPILGHGQIGHGQIGQLGQKEGSAADTQITIHESMHRLDWPAGGWQELHAALLDFWSAPRRASGEISRRTPAEAERLAFSHLCDHWRQRHLPNEKDGTRARAEAARALAAFGVMPPTGWEA